MSEERLKILDMLKEGKITAEEASELLKYISDEDEALPGYHRNIKEHLTPRSFYGPDFGYKALRNRLPWNIMIPVHVGFALLGTSIGGVIGFFYGGGIFGFVYFGLINTLIGAGVGGMIGGIVATTCNSIIFIMNRRKCNE